MWRMLLHLYTVCCHLLQQCQRRHLALFQSRFGPFVGCLYIYFRSFCYNASFQILMYGFSLPLYYNQQLFTLHFCSPIFQELHAYEEMNPLGPELCQRRQMQIISILLQNVYNTEDSGLQKSRILLKKARTLRAMGREGLKDCIQCLSEAISFMVIYLIHFLSLPISNQLIQFLVVNSCLFYS